MPDPAVLFLVGAETRMTLMLSCKDVSERASAMIDGELSVWDTMRMRLHLAMCKGCSTFMTQMRATKAMIDTAATAPDDDADTDAQVSDILSRLHARKQSGD